MIGRNVSVVTILYNKTYIHPLKVHLLELLKILSIPPEHGTMNIKLLNLAVFFGRFHHIGFKWKIQAGAKVTWHQRRLY